MIARFDRCSTAKKGAFLPLYEYECAKCHQHTERIENLKGPFLKKCPKCGGRLERLMSAPAIQFKGSGWYVTDYAKSSGSGSSDKKQAESSSESGKGTDKGSAKGESKGESKAADKAPAAKEKGKAAKEK